MQDGTPTNVQKPVAELTIGRQAAEKGEANRSLARLAPWLAWSLWALSIVFGALTLLLAYANREHPVFPRAPLISWFVPTLAIVPTVGALVASRRPRNPIGWTFLFVGLALFGLFAEQYAGYTLDTQPGALPGGLLMAWTSAWTSSLGILVMVTFTFLLFPTGQLPSPRPRPAAWAYGALITLYCLWLAIKPGPILPRIAASRNPLGVEQAAGAIDLIEGLFMLIFTVVITTSISSLIQRFFHARGEERQQLKWIVYTGSLTIAMFACLAILEYFLHIRERMAEYQDVAVLPRHAAPSTATAASSRPASSTRSNRSMLISCCATRRTSRRCS
jgi:two-component system, NarL family, sensor kinase